MQWTNNSESLIFPWRKSGDFVTLTLNLNLITTFFCFIPLQYFFPNSLDLYSTWEILPPVFFFFQRGITDILSPLILTDGSMGNVAVRGHSGVLILQHFICVWGIQTSVEKKTMLQEDSLVWVAVIFYLHRRSAKHHPACGGDIWWYQSCLNQL